MSVCSLVQQASQSSGELVIPNARAADSGLYICRITDTRTQVSQQTTTVITITEAW